LFRNIAKKGDTTYLNITIASSSNILTAPIPISSKEVEGPNPVFNEVFQFASLSPDGPSPKETLSIQVKEAKGMMYSILGNATGTRWMHRTLSEATLNLCDLFKGKASFVGCEIDDVLFSFLRYLWFRTYFCW
jgi:hypothetical protein